MILKVVNVNKCFGGLVALRDLSLDIKGGRFYGLIGPNGSGKTTLFNVITGFLKPEEGHVFYKGRQIEGLQPYRIAQMGVGRTFQITRVFTKMTVLENLLAASPRIGKEVRERAAEILKNLGIFGLRDRYGGETSYGQRRLVELAKLVMMNSELLLLDEPASGLHPEMIAKIIDAIKLIHKSGRTIIVIEHNISFVMNLCERIIVLNCGEKIDEGSPNEIRNSKAVLEAYLGGE